MHFQQAIQVKHNPQGIIGGVPKGVRVELLGGFRVSVGSHALDESEWRLRKASSLVKLLALAPQHRLHREQVMDLLWSDLDPKAAANNLRYVLHKARRTLEQSAAAPSRCLHLQGDLLALSPNGLLWVDAEAFEDAAAAAHRTQNQAAYEAALKLYAGDLLPMDRYEAWAEDRRQKLQGTYLALLLEMAELHEKRGDFGLAIEAFGRVLAVEPTHEGARVGLTRLYTLWGQQDQALRQCEQFRRLFHMTLAPSLTCPTTTSIRSRLDNSR